MTFQRNVIICDGPRAVPVELVSPDFGSRAVEDPVFVRAYARTHCWTTESDGDYCPKCDES